MKQYFKKGKPTISVLKYIVYNKILTDTHILCVYINTLFSIKYLDTHILSAYGGSLNRTALMKHKLKDSE
jgi:hypothetical protein